MSLRYIPFILFAISCSIVSCAPKQVNCSEVIDKQIAHNADYNISVLKACGSFEGDDTVLLDHTLIYNISDRIYREGEKMTYRNLLASFEKAKTEKGCKEIERLLIGTKTASK